MKRSRVRALFAVQLAISDRWVTFEDAQRLPQAEAHVRGAAEAAVHGAHRVRVVPVGHQ